jgi:serine/threonine-protein kinase RsbT
MPTLVCEEREIRSSEDVVSVRQLVRAQVVALEFSLIDQTKLVTAASELARNTLEHGGGGRVTLRVIEDGRRVGLRLIFEDDGPGIANVDQAMKDGFSTGKGLGLGLGGAKRLSNEFQIESAAGHGTRVTIARWK